MWRNVGVKSDEDQDVEIDDEEELVESDGEIARQRDILYGIMIPTSSPHGVTCLMKTLDASILFLKMSRLIDRRLQNNSKIEASNVFIKQVTPWGDDVGIMMP